MNIALLAYLLALLSCGYTLRMRNAILFLWLYLQQVSSSSKRLQQDSHPNKVGGRYNNITAGDDESNFPTRERLASTQ